MDAGRCARLGNLSYGAVKIDSITALSPSLPEAFPSATPVTPAFQQLLNSFPDYCRISRFFVSGTKSIPIKKVTSATMMGYQRPA
jgi:hypothetical protein